MKLARLLTLAVLSLELSGCLLAPLQPEEREMFHAVYSEWPTGAPEYQKVCPLHGAPTIAQEVPVVDGMTAVDRKYMKARVRRFPYSFMALYSGGCEFMGERSEERPVCPKCREEEERWLQRHPDRNRG